MCLCQQPEVHVATTDYQFPVLRQHVPAFNEIKARHKINNQKVGPRLHEEHPYTPLSTAFCRMPTVIYNMKSRLQALSI